MKVVTSAEMRHLESRAAELGLTSSVLMENAGLAVARAVRDWVDDIANRVVCVLVGPGNNGGDGLVAARHLHDWGARVSVVLCSRTLSDDPNLEKVRERNSLVLTMEESATEAVQDLLSESEIVIDALLGTGVSRPITGIVGLALELLRQTKAVRPNVRIAALDLPSGLNSDTGAVDPATVAADLTVTLGSPKRGLFLFPGAAFIGKLQICDIGIPAELEADLPVDLLRGGWAAQQLPERFKGGHKGTFGRLLVVAGSTNYIGAAALACAAALRVGAGLVTLATPQSLVPIFATKLTETTFLPLPEEEPGYLSVKAVGPLNEALPTYDAVLVGCGLSNKHQVEAFFVSWLHAGRELLATRPLVVDADGLNILAHQPERSRLLPPQTVLTPHSGELARLSSRSTAEIEGARLESAQQAAALWRAVVVLKGAYTIVADPSGASLLSPFANPLLASAGTGDVLAGAISGLLTQGLAAFTAAGCGVYLHAMAGELCRQEIGDAGLLASDLLPKLPLALKQTKAGLAQNTGEATPHWTF